MSVNKKIALENITIHNLLNKNKTFKMLYMNNEICLMILISLKILFIFYNIVYLIILSAILCFKHLYVVII